MVGIFFQILLLEISFEICLENISIQSLFGRESPFTDCLVANFSSDIYIYIYIFGSNLIFKNCLAEIFFPGGRFFPQIFFGRGFF